METSINTFEKGMVSDSGIYDTQTSSYIHAINLINAGTYGLLKLHNESGNTAFSLQLPFKYIVGRFVIDDYIILFGTDNDDVTTNGNCEIGVVDNVGIYTTKVGNLTVTPNVQLAFNALNQIDVSARKLFNNDVVVYFTDNVNPMRVINIDFPPITAINFLEAIQINNFQKVPYITPVSILNGGNIYAGRIQFVARYLNDDLAPTTFGIVSPSVCITDDNENITNRKDYDGADFNTLCRKSVEAIIENIDTDFTYVEIAAITYKEATTTPDIRLFRREQIDNRSSITFVYSGYEETIATSNVNELNQALVLYTHAKCVEQKDNRLFWSNLKTKPITNYQGIANTVKLKYFIETVTYTQAYNVNVRDTSPQTGGWQDMVTDYAATRGDYSLAEYTSNRVGYLRGEVYAFGIMFILTDGTITPVYHLQGNTTGLPSAKPQYLLADTGTQDLGGYISTEQYNNVSGLTGNVVYHLMPTSKQEPLKYGNDIRLLGVKVDTSATVFPAEVAQYVLVRKERTDNNKSILMQGLIRPLTYGYKDKNTVPVQPAEPVGWLKPSTVSDIYEHLFNRFADFTPYVRGVDIATKTCAMFSPESVIYEKNIDGGQYIEVAHKIFPIDIYQYADKNAGAGSFQGSLGHQRWHWSYIDVDNISYSSASNIPFTGTDISLNRYTNNVSKTQCLNNNGGNVPYPVSEATLLDNEVCYAGDSNKYLAIKLQTAHTFVFNDLEIYNVRRDLQAQYANVDNGSYITCGNPRNLTDGNFSWYGGDIYVSKFGNVMSYALAEVPASNVSDASLLSDCCDQALNLSGSIRTNDRTLAVGIEIKELQYFFVETTINTNLRHRAVSDDGASFGVKYFPKETVLTNFKSKKALADGVFDSAGRFGNAKGYNVQYSKENNIRSYNTLPFAFVEVVNYPYRTIYSEYTTGQERSDMFKRYLPNNFQEIPKHTGEIFDSFVFENTLFLHTKHALYRTYVNEREALASTLGQVYTGVGAVFALQPSPVLTLQGGYGGTASQFSYGETPYGYVFVDSLQQKVFLLSGGQLSELTEAGISLWYQNNTEKYHIDNPAFKNGYIIAYDGKYKRLILTYVDRVNPDKQFTLSFSFLSRTWTSYHSYVPNVYISKDNRHYAVMNTAIDENDTSVLRRIYEQSTGLKGIWFDAEKQNTTLTFIVNNNVAYEKTFSSFSFDTAAYDQLTGERNIVETFKVLRVRNSKQNTGNIVLNCGYPYILATHNVRYLQGRYNTAVPKNKLITNQSNIYDVENDMLLTPIIPYGVKADRIRDKFIKVTLTYDNVYEMVINFINSLYMPFIR